MSEGFDEPVFHPGADEVGRFGSGQAVRRLEDPQLVTGHGFFADDALLPDQTYLAFCARRTRTPTSSVSIPPPQKNKTV